jgi:general secretion pathway protein G
MTSEPAGPQGFREPTRKFPTWAKVVIMAVPVWIVWLGLVATIVMPAVMKVRFDAKRPKALADITAVYYALEEYAIEHRGTYPAALDELLTADRERAYFAQDQLPLDPWGRPYVYRQPSAADGRPFVATYGEDGVPGGDGDDRDSDMESIRSSEIDED